MVKTEMGLRIRMHPPTGLLLVLQNLQVAWVWKMSWMV